MAIGVGQGVTKHVSGCLFKLALQPAADRVFLYFATGMTNRARIDRSHDLQRDQMSSRFSVDCSENHEKRFRREAYAEEPT